MRLVLAGSQEMFLDALGSALAHRGHDIAGSTTDRMLLPHLIEQRRPRVCVVEDDQDPGELAELASALRATIPRVGLVMITSKASTSLWAAYFDRLVDGLVSRECGFRLLDQVIDQVGAGKRTVRGFSPVPEQRRGPPQSTPDLTPREQTIVEMLVAGYASDRMARELGLSVHTVRSHVQHVMTKYGVDSRSKVASRASTHLRETRP